MISLPVISAWQPRILHRSAHPWRVTQPAAGAWQSYHPQEPALPELHIAGVEARIAAVPAHRLHPADKPGHTAVAQRHLVGHTSVAGDG